MLEKDFAHPDGEQRKFGIYYARFPKVKTGIIHFDPNDNEVEAIGWFSFNTTLEKMRSSPSQFVPSVNAVWPDTFEAMRG